MFKAVKMDKCKDLNDFDQKYQIVMVRGLDDWFRATLKLQL